MLAPGTRLGPYEIVSPLGAGGMGEVYRARDTRLDRTVALKVLAGHRITDPQMRQRFDREARAVAALSHPHICHLNDVGHDNGVDFLVMEYLEGETLAARLARGRLPLNEVLHYAIQIAEALVEAHRHGIVHRDLKPGNVILTKTGVKLLDFGLAKLQPIAAGPASLSTQGPTRETPLTGEGSILGTWPYMSPEQVEGKEADARTDLFAFGAVLYEMATGRRAFAGDSHASLIAAILERDPEPFADQLANAPVALERVVRKCLAKDPAARWQSARDLADTLKWMAREHHSLAEGSVADDRRARAFGWRWVAALIVAAGIGAAMAWSVPRRDVTTSPVRRFTIHPPSDAPLNRGGGLAFSPNGRTLTYVADTGRGLQLYVRALDQLSARVVPGTEGGLMPTFSPDGEWIAFVADGKLKKVSSTSGAPAITLSDFSPVIDQSMAWLPDNSIIVGQQSTGLFRVSANGGVPSSMTPPDTGRGEIDLHNPRAIPRANSLLITVHRGSEAWDVATLDLDTGARQVVVPDAFDARYVSTGHLVFARGESLLAVPFDLDRLAVSGPAVVLVDRLATNLNNGAARYDVAADGSLAYIPPPSRHGRRLAWLDRRGAVEHLPIEPRAFFSPSLSPDGKRIAVRVSDGGRRDIWIAEVATGGLTRLTTDGASESPIWTRDGQRVTFSTAKAGRREIYWQPIDGTAPAELLVSDSESVFPGSWSADGQALAYTRQPPTDQTDIGLFELKTRRPTIVIGGERYDLMPRISPDGQWLAYTSSSLHERQEVFVTTLAGDGARRQISNSGGEDPVWGLDGRELFYRTGVRTNTQFLVMDVSNLPASIGKPRLVAGPVRVATSMDFGHPGYDVAGDGRLLIVQPADEEFAPSHVEIVLNWFEELKQRVPVGR
jgi:eukaryotic-like serine/threonine-protein kinase